MLQENLGVSVCDTENQLLEPFLNQIIRPNF